MEIKGSRVGIFECNFFNGIFISLYNLIYLFFIFLIGNFLLSVKKNCKLKITKYCYNLENNVPNFDQNFIIFLKYNALS